MQNKINRVNSEVVTVRMGSNVKNCVLTIKNRIYNLGLGYQRPSCANVITVDNKTRKLIENTQKQYLDEMKDQYNLSDADVTYIKNHLNVHNSKYLRVK